MNKISRCSAPEYCSWSHILQRCTNPDDPAFRNYGGRGIRVCRQWRSFDNFLADVGKRPSKGYSIHRKDNDGHYEPGNVVWADWITQNNSRRDNRLITVHGDLMTVANAGRRFGINHLVIHNRLRRGWPEEKAATHPLVPNDKSRSKRKQ